ncbi:MAG: TonB-dependent receptor [Pseudohongiellaceae bacterium]
MSSRLSVARVVLVSAVLSCFLMSSARAQQPSGQGPDILALPFTEIPESPRHATEANVDEPRSGFSASGVEEPPDSTYHIGISYTPETRGFGLHADAWEVETDNASLSSLTPSLVRDPSLAAEDGAAVRLSDANQDALLNISGGPGRRSRGIDLTASYVWESSRFGQFIVSTRATYVYNQQNLEGLKEPGSMEHPLLSQVPELQSSLMLSWQSGNHEATATTHIAADSFEAAGDMQLQELDELMGHIATLDLRYGYNISSGRKSNTEISVGLRNTLDRRPLQQLRVGGSTRSGGVLDANGSVAYGTIKYQF